MADDLQKPAFQDKITSAEKAKYEEAKKRRQAANDTCWENHERVIDGAGVTSNGDHWTTPGGVEPLKVLREQLLRRSHEWDLLHRCAKPCEKVTRGAAAKQRFSAEEAHCLRNDTREFLRQHGLHKSTQCIKGQPSLWTLSKVSYK